MSLSNVFINDNQDQIAINKQGICIKKIDLRLISS